MDEDRPRGCPALRLELGKQAVDVVDVPRPLDLRDHDHLEAVADLGDERRQVVEHPGRLERVHAGPQRAVAEVGLAPHPDETLARRDLAVDRHGVLEVAEEHVAPGREVGSFAAIFSLPGSKKWIIRDGLERDLEDRLWGALWESGFAKSRGFRTTGPILTRGSCGTLATP